jgi:hypothetical protein
MATEETKREKFTVDVKEGVSLSPIESGVDISSEKLCDHIFDFFSGIFADFEDCQFNVIGQQKPTITIYFNHGNYSESDRLGVKKGGDKELGNSILDRSRRRDRIIASGDRYFLTEDAKDILEELIPHAFNQKIDWKNYVSEINFSAYQGGVRQPNLTAVSGLSVEKLCEKIKLIGPNDPDDRYEYAFTIKAELTNGNMMIMGNNFTRNYLLTIMKASEKELDKVYAELGYISGSSRRRRK